MSAEDLAGLAALIVVVIAGFFIWSSDAKKAKCEKSCMPQAFRMIDNDCYCATAKGWGEK